MKNLIQKFKKTKKLGFMAMAALALAALPISASAGAPSQAITFDNGGFTFGLGDIMTTAWNFIGEFNTYLILILALIIVPTLIGFALWLVSKAPKFRKSKG